MTAIQTSCRSSLAQAANGAGPVQVAALCDRYVSAEQQLHRALQRAQRHYDDIANLARGRSLSAQRTCQLAAEEVERLERDLVHVRHALSVARAELEESGPRSGPAG